MIYQEYNKLRPYKNKRKKSNLHPILNLWHYHDFLMNEFPFYTDEIVKNNNTFKVKIFKGRWDTLTPNYSLSFCCFINTNETPSEGYLAVVRYIYRDFKIRGQRIYQWIPSVSWYKSHPEFGFYSLDSQQPLANAELLEVMEHCLEKHRHLDYRYLNFDKIRPPIISSLFEKDPSFLYLIQCELTKKVKIGRTADPRRRYLAIDCNTPTTIRLITTIHSDYAIVIDELLKNHFKHQCFKKEWFSLSNADINRIINKQLPYPINQYLGEVQIFEPYLI